MCLHCQGLPTSLLPIYPPAPDDFPPVPLTVRNSLGREMIMDKMIGKGGFGRVYRARDSSSATQKVYAVKMMNRAVIAKEAAHGLQLDNEVNVHKSMGTSHPHIVPFISSFLSPTILFMQLEFCPNGSLQDLITTRYRATESEMRFWCTQLIGAIHHVHKRHVIHRDIKMANLVLDKNMNVMLTDFGIAATLLSKLDRRGTFVGSPDFTAPEVAAQGDMGHSFEVDVWAIGVLLLFSLTGTRPFYAAETTLIYDRIVAGDFSIPPSSNISIHTRSLINSILVTDPHKRPSLIKILEHPFFTQAPFPSQIPTDALRSIPKYPRDDYFAQQSLENFERIKRIAKVPVQPVEPFIEIITAKKRARTGNEAPKGKKPAKAKVVAEPVKAKVAKRSGKENPTTLSPPARPKTRSQTKKEQESEDRLKKNPVIPVLLKEGKKGGKMPRVAALKEEAKVMPMR